MRALASAVVTISLVLAFFAATPHIALASSGVLYFHGRATDDVDKQAAFADSTAISNATFSATAPSGTVPILQSTTAVANQDFVGNPLTAYWHGPFSGTISGQLKLDWWWTVPSPTGTT